MNRDDRRKIKRVVQDYDRNIRTAHADFEKTIGILQFRESGKLNALPPSLESSPTADNLTEAVEMLTTILKKDEEITELLDEILCETGVSSDFVPVTVTNKDKIVSTKKDVSFHALLPSNLLKRLREESLRTGLSMNEIVCQALLKAL